MITFTRHTLLPGEFVIASAPTLISTILGSCVSICLWDRDLKLGGMNHYLLPGVGDEDAGNPDRGIASAPMLIMSMFDRNAKIESMEAKVFGGCNSLYREKNVFKIGERNVAIAFSILKDYNINVTASNVGGSYGRKIVFNTTTGKVRMRLLMDQLLK
jgi:chemotaxis protein CheD